MLRVIFTIHTIYFIYIYTYISMQLFTTERVVEKACVLDTNAFGERSNVTSQQFSTGLFYYAAMLNHSCDPNVSYSVVSGFSKVPFFVSLIWLIGNKITFRAIKPILKNTPLYDTYVELLFPTHERQLALLKSKFFFCSCTR